MCAAASAIQEVLGQEVLGGGLVGLGLCVPGDVDGLWGSGVDVGGVLGVDSGECPVWGVYSCGEGSLGLGVAGQPERPLPGLGVVAGYGYDGWVVFAVR